MGRVTEFLLRWLYLANLIDDRIDIQNLPHPRSVHVNDIHTQNPTMTGQGLHATEGPVPGLGPNLEPPPLSQASTQMNTQAMGSYVPTNSVQSQTSLADRRNRIENEWKQKCLRGLAMYPPGTPRRIALDSLRVEIVNNLASQLRRADELLRKHMTKKKKSKIDSGAGAKNSIVSCSGSDRGDGVTSDSRHSARSEHSIVLDLADPESSSTPNNTIPNDSQRPVTEEEEYDDEQTLDDSLLDADLEIIEALRLVTEGETLASNDDKIENVDPIHQSHDKTSYDQNHYGPSNEEVVEAQALLMEAREYLPQLVSVVLHSKPPLTPQPSLHPIRSMRKLLIARCMEDPSLGIELCWLLEAEVGRAWKSLFEHRQQTGRRLIVVLPAEKARVIAKIGTEKKAAFDLLQDAEQATAYGSTTATSVHHSDHAHNQYLHHHPSTSGSATTYTNSHNDPDYAFPLPAAISLKRCSHFGDTMHFIDSLTQISLDLRLVPNLERNAHLQQRLDELNRRLRRRMVTRGAVSIDVEDSLTHEDWPHLSDVTLDMLRYSVHMPLEPKSIIWEGGDDHPSFVNATGSTSSNQKIKTGVMRVLNIVAHDCRILASRERCPFLVHVEIAETGLEGSDARLYAGGGIDAGESSTGNNNLQSGTFGVSLEEVIRLFASSKKKTQNERKMQINGQDQLSGSLPKEENFASYRLPAELLSKDVTFLSKSNAQKDYTATTQIKASTTASTKSSSSSDVNYSPELINSDIELPRGGGQYPEEDGFYVPDTEYGNGMMDENYGMYNNEILRQQQIQKLHDQMLSERLLQQNQMGIPQGYTQNQGLSHPQKVMHKIKSELLDSVFGVTWKKKCEQIRLSSPYGKIKGWRLASFIMKAGEDIRREALVMQVISKLKDWFDEEIPSNQRPYLRPYSIMCVGGDAGLLECLPDAKSVDEIKKQTDDFSTLRDYFERAYGLPTRKNNLQQPYQYSNAIPGASGNTIPQVPYPQHYQYNPQPNSPSQIIHPPPPQPVGADHSVDDSITFEQAQENFLRSLVGYSLVCFILQIKDRHNANILMDREGHLLHIDFGFVLGDTPKMGKVPLFSERAPFKLTAEFWDVIGGWNVNEGGQGVRFCKMFEAAFACASAHAEELASLVEAAVLNLTSNGARARLLANGVRQRLKMRGPKDSAEQKQFIMDLVDASLSSWGTSTYDWLQKSMNGYQ